MSMVGHEGPCITERLGFWEKGRETINKIVPIGIVPEDICPFYTPDHHMMEYSGGIESCLAGHARKNSRETYRSLTKEMFKEEEVRAY